MNMFHSPLPALSRLLTKKRPQPLKGSMCIIPFCSGDGKPETQRRRVKRKLAFLRETIIQSRNYFEQISVTVCTEYDFNAVRKMRLKNHTCLMSDVVSPVVLANRSLMAFQNVLQRNHRDIQYIYYTEADQLVYFDDILRDAALLGGGAHISPVRIEKKFGEGISGRGIDIVFKGHPYNAYTVYGQHGLDAYQRLQERRRQSGYFVTRDPMEAYGAAWLCTKDLFMNIPFNIVLQNSPRTSPSYNIIVVSNALKAVNWERCFVEHLSGYEHQKRELQTARQKGRIVSQNV